MHQNISKCICKDVYINIYSPRYIIIMLNINQHTHTCNSIYTYTSRHQHTAQYTYCISDFFHSKTSPTGPTEQTPKKSRVSNNSRNFGGPSGFGPIQFLTKPYIQSLPGHRQSCSCIPKGDLRFTGSLPNVDSPLIRC